MDTIEATEHALARVSPQPDSMLAIIDRMTSTPGFDIAALKEMLAMKERWDANEARKAFAEAKAAFQAEAIVIIRDKTNNQYNSKYVSLGQLVKTVTPFLSKHGLSCSWAIDQSNGIRVACTMLHSLGHSETVSMVCPLDTSGAKNPVQQVKSSITYGKGCTFESVTGMAATDANRDDDGNAAGAATSEPLEEDVVVMRLDAIANASNDDELKRFYLVALHEAQAAGDKAAVEAYGKAKNKKYRDLHPSGGQR